jgi:hypothetical protein
MSKQKPRGARQGPKQHGARPRPRTPRPQEPGGAPPWLPAIVLVAVVGIAVAIFFLTRPGPPAPPPKQSTYVAQLAAVQPSVLRSVGKGSAYTTNFKHVSEPALTTGGKPELLYMGAEYCPYCAGERWALIVALSRFGSFSGVQPITSSEGNLPTFTFHGATYTSSYLVFRPVETADRNGNPLDKPTAAESALESRYASGIPFVDFNNGMVFEGATYDVTALQGLNWQQVVNALQTSSSAPAQGILGSANLITAGICQMTGQQPGSVCQDSSIQALERQLPSS